MCEDSIEHRIQHLVQTKQTLADGVLDGQGDLDKLKMPSSRAGRVEQMAAMIARPRNPVQPAPDPGRTLAEAAGERLDRPIIALARSRAEDGGETALVVVEDLPDETARRDVDAAANAAGFASARVIDRTSWETIRQLTDVGVLKFAGAVETLQTEAADDAPDADTREAARRREAARPWLKASDPLAAAAAAAVRVVALVQDTGIDPDGTNGYDARDLAERPAVRTTLPAGPPPGPRTRTGASRGPTARREPYMQAFRRRNPPGSSGQGETFEAAARTAGLSVDPNSPSRPATARRR